MCHQIINKSEAKEISDNQQEKKGIYVLYFIHIAVSRQFTTTYFLQDEIFLIRKFDFI